MKLKQVEVSLSCTRFPKPYNACKAEATVVFQVESTDSWEDVEQEARKLAVEQLEGHMQALFKFHEEQEKQDEEDPSGGW